MPERPNFRVVHGGKAPLFICYSCGATTPAKSSACPHCGRFDTLEREGAELAGPEDIDRTAKHAIKLSVRPPKFISTGSAAWDAVLGGGLVKPSSVLVYGPRGVGKSTRALGIALHVAELLRAKVLYGSAEMPAEHIRMYAERLRAPKSAIARLWVQDSNEAGDLLDNIDQIRPAVVIWDSVQRMTWYGELGDNAMRQVVHHAIDSGKQHRHISILLSQVSKEESYLGPSGIGHDVDVMIRLTRNDRDLIVEAPDKNRFAPTPATATESFFA